MPEKPPDSAVIFSTHKSGGPDDGRSLTVLEAAYRQAAMDEQQNEQDPAEMPDTATDRMDKPNETETESVMEWEKIWTTLFDKPFSQIYLEYKQKLLSVEKDTALSERDLRLAILLRIDLGAPEILPFIPIQIRPYAQNIELIATLPEKSSNPQEESLDSLTENLPTELRALLELQYSRNTINLATNKQIIESIANIQIKGKSGLRYPEASDFRSAMEAQSRIIETVESYAPTTVHIYEIGHQISTFIGSMAEQDTISASEEARHEEIKIITNRRQISPETPLRQEDILQNISLLEDALQTKIESFLSGLFEMPQEYKSQAQESLIAYNQFLIEWFGQEIQGNATYEKLNQLISTNNIVMKFF